LSWIFQSYQSIVHLESITTRWNKDICLLIIVTLFYSTVVFGLFLSFAIIFILPGTQISVT